MSFLLGCIGDDFTGSTDLANTLVQQGMRTVQFIGIPSTGVSTFDADAVVIALKSRTIPAKEAVAQSLEALSWLQNAGCHQFFFKYCSTFDSTDAGNIGPVAEALLEALESNFTIVCPAFPETGRTIFKGHLFVGDVLLNASGMEHHPLTPMTDPNLVRVLDRQTKGRVGLVQYGTVCKGTSAIRKALERLRSDGFRFAVVDAVEDAHLEAIGEAVANMPLVTGGSGIALGLPENLRRQGLLSLEVSADALPKIEGKAAVLSGSCSRTTQEQVVVMKRMRPAFRLDVMTLAEGHDQIDQAVEWALPLLDDGPVLIYTTDTPDAVQAVQEKLGRERAGELAEQAQAEIACRLVAAGVRRLVIAGGETSGAVVKTLGIKGLRIGPQIDPGIPWTANIGDPPIALALKSGNFGAPDFFLKAFKRLL